MCDTCNPAPLQVQCCCTRAPDMQPTALLQDTYVATTSLQVKHGFVPHTHAGHRTTTPSPCKQLSCLPLALPVMPVVVVCSDGDAMLHCLPVEGHIKGCVNMNQHGLGHSGVFTLASAYVVPCFAFHCSLLYQREPQGESSSNNTIASIISINHILSRCHAVTCVIS
jgi:hypothetical protein